MGHFAHNVSYKQHESRKPAILDVCRCTAHLVVNCSFPSFLVKGVYSGWGASLAVNLETFSIRQVS